MNIPMSIYHVKSGLWTRSNFSADGLHPTRTNKIAYFSKFLECFKEEWLFSPMNTEDKKIEEAVACFREYCSIVLNQSLDYDGTKENLFFLNMQQKCLTHYVLMSCSTLVSINQ